MSQKLSDPLKKELLRMKPEEFTVSWITANFGVHGDMSGKINQPRINATDVCMLAKNEYINKEEISTTAGRILFNKICIEGKCDKITGYVNYPMTKKAFGGLLNLLAQNIMEGKFTTNEYANFIKSIEFYGLKCCAIFTYSFDEKLLKPNRDLLKEKDKRLKEIESNKDLTDSQKMLEYSKLEADLTKKAKDAIGKDPSMTLFNSGARGDFDVEYKVMALMGGLVPNTEKGAGQYDFMKSNYMDGLDKEDIPKAGNIVVGASYPRAVATSVGGYMTKQFYSVYQTIVLDDPGTDCGSKFTLPVLLTPQRANDYMYQYMVEGENKKVCLTPENVKSYIGKVVHFRSPMGCLGDKICHVCAGDRFRRLNIKNIGLTTGRISNGIMDKNMQAFHQTKVKWDEADPDKLLME